jgi:CsoR family transcriptional regulator, copper-sensing transcriptional repressor
MPAIRAPKHQQALVMRLKRIEGQLRAIQAMIAAGEDCEKVAHQLSASRKALDKAFFHLIACAIQADAPAGSRRMRNVADLLAKFG